MENRIPKLVNDSSVEYYDNVLLNNIKVEDNTGLILGAISDPCTDLPVDPCTIIPEDPCTILPAHTSATLVVYIAADNGSSDESHLKVGSYTITTASYNETVLTTVESMIQYIGGLSLDYTNSTYDVNTLLPPRRLSGTCKNTCMLEVEGNTNLSTYYTNYPVSSMRNLKSLSLRKNDNIVSYSTTTGYQMYYYLYLIVDPTPFSISLYVNGGTIPLATWAYNSWIKSIYNFLGSSVITRKTDTSDPANIVTTSLTATYTVNTVTQVSNILKVVVRDLNLNLEGVVENDLDALWNIIYKNYDSNSLVSESYYKMNSAGYNVFIYVEDNLFTLAGKKVSTVNDVKTKISMHSSWGSSTFPAKFLDINRCISYNTITELDNALGPTSSTEIYTVSLPADSDGGKRLTYIDNVYVRARTIEGIGDKFTECVVVLKWSNMLITEGTGYVIWFSTDYGTNNCKHYYDTNVGLPLLAQLVSGQTMGANLTKTLEVYSDYTCTNSETIAQLMNAAGSENIQLYPYVWVQTSNLLYTQLSSATVYSGSIGSGNSIEYHFELSSGTIIQ